MSMHLVGPYLTTTSYKKRKVKITKAKQIVLESDWRDRNQRLKQMGLPKETFEQFLEWVHGKGRKTKAETKSRSKYPSTTPIMGSATEKIIQTAKTPDSSSEIPSQDKSNNIQVSRARNWITGPVSSKPSPTYTGTKVIGIAVMHKSCLQPVFSQEAAEDSAKMRR